MQEVYRRGDPEPLNTQGRRERPRGSTNNTDNTVRNTLLGGGAGFVLAKKLQEKGLIPDNAARPLSDIIAPAAGAAAGYKMTNRDKRKAQNEQRQRVSNADRLRR